MLNLQTIYKPTTLADALARLAAPNTAILAGGTALVASHRRDVVALVDLSGLHLDTLTERDGDLVLGATSTLAALFHSSLLRAAADGILAQAAHRAHASLLRNQATAAGTLLAEPDSIFTVALSAVEASVTRAYAAPDGRVTFSQVSVADLLAHPEAYLGASILTEVVVPAASRAWRAELDFVARTPRDRPIVSVCAALELKRGIVPAGAIALGGVAASAWRARDAERLLLGAGLTDDVIDRAAMAATTALEPASDFRASAAYRTEMARVLTGRALRAIQGRGSR